MGRWRMLACSEKVARNPSPVRNLHINMSRALAPTAPDDAMAAAVETRKRCAAAFLLDEPPHQAKRGCRLTPCEGEMAPAAALQRFDPLDALRRVFPDADLRNLETCFAASGQDIHATVQAYRAHQSRDALATRLARAARADDGADECAGVLVEQMAAATDVADAKNRASWILGLIKDAVAELAAAGLREENAAAKREAAGLREENARLREQAAALEHDKAVLKRGVLVQHKLHEEMERGVLAKHQRLEETERAAAEMKKKVAELEMANYALSVRLRDADGCRFQAHRGPGPDVF